MPENDGRDDAAISRRKFLSGTAAVSISITAGCLGNSSDEYEVVSQGEIIEIVKFSGINDGFANPGGSVIYVNVEGGTESKSIVWLGPDGRQLEAAKVPFGGEEDIRLHYGEGPQTILGTNQLVAVSGGELNCGVMGCEQSGGEPVDRVKFEVGKA